MKATQAFRLTSIAFAAALTAASSAHATSWFGFEGGSQLINCALGECFRPPDTMGAVGTTQFLETANGYIRIYDKTTGAVQSSVNMEVELFFASLFLLYQLIGYGAVSFIQFHFDRSLLVRDIQIAHG